MRVRTLCLISVIFVIAPAAMAQSDPFTIQLPSGYSEFKKSTQNTQSKDGTIETTSWLSKDPKGSAVVVTVSKFPKKVLAPVKLLDGTRDSLAKSTSATIDTDDTVSANPPTRQITMHSAGAWVKARLIAKTDTLYQVIFIGHTADAPGAAPITQMFEGFRAQ